jgi:hypothetical protein
MERKYHIKGLTMKSLLLKSHATARTTIEQVFELDPAPSEQVSGDCGCDEKRVGKTQTEEGTHYSVDEK